jgi:hypothetical protein
MEVDIHHVVKVVVKREEYLTQGVFYTLKFLVTDKNGSMDELILFSEKEVKIEGEVNGRKK